MFTSIVVSVKQTSWVIFYQGMDGSKSTCYSFTEEVIMSGPIWVCWFKCNHQH